MFRFFEFLIYYFFFWYVLLIIISPIKIQWIDKRKKSSKEEKRYKSKKRIENFVSEFKFHENIVNIFSKCLIAPLVFLTTFSGTKNIA